MPAAGRRMFGATCRSCVVRVSHGVCMLTTKLHRCRPFWSATHITSSLWPKPQLTSLVTISHLQQRWQVAIGGLGKNPGEHHTHGAAFTSQAFAQEHHSRHLEQARWGHSHHDAGRVNVDLQRVGSGVMGHTGSSALLGKPRKER